MPTIPPQIDPETPLRDAEPLPPALTVSETSPDANAPLSFVPNTPAGAVAPVRIRTGRYGEMEEHELLHLLDSIEDELARRRFRESLYISFITCVLLALVVLYGPKYLWHAPQLINPADVLKNREVVQLNAPILPHSLNKPTLKPAPKALDNKTLEKLRSMSPPAPVPPAPTPSPATPTPPVATSPAPVPPTPTPQPTRAPLAEAPTPQPTTKPNFSTPGTASDSMKSLLNSRNRPGGSGSHDTVSTGKGGNVGGGVEVLSDMQGVDFSDYLRRLKSDVYRNWIPLLPEETEPPLLKQGETYIRFTILPGGQIGNMVLEGSSHDVAIDKAAWGSIISEGQFPPLPKQFHGPNLELRFHYMVNLERR
jgi:outer membrane biosynthesis protein TonB